MTCELVHRVERSNRGVGPFWIPRLGGTIGIEMDDMTMPTGAARDGADTADLLVGLGSDARSGLDEAEAARRLVEVGPNELPPARPRALWLRVVDQLREPMSLLLLAAAVVSGFALGERVDAVAIGAIVAINAVVALVQEGRAGRALAALQELSAPEATVVRSGVVRRVPARELVPGDVIRIEAGDRVPADARLLELDLLEIDESMLTGESVPVAKALLPDTSPTLPGGDSPDRLLWGTFATRGTGTALVVATGAATMLGRIAASLDTPPPPTPLQQELARLSARLGVAAVVIALGVFGLMLVRVGVSIEGLERSFLSAVALAVAAVPEGLPTVTLVALAAGVRRMAVHRTIVRRLPAVETLGSASVIVTDKTGTITENRMTVTAAWSLGSDGHDIELLPVPVLGRTRVISVLANDATLDPPTGDPMELALLRFVGAHAVDAERGARARLRAFPVDSERRRMSSVHRGPGGLLVVAKGAPESLLDACNQAVQPDGHVRALTADERGRVLAEAARMASEGMRVLALAERPVGDEPRDASEAEQELTLVALLGLEDPVRPNAAATVAESFAAGVRVVMATGDHPATALAIGRDVGLDTGRPPVTGTQIADDGLPDDPLAATIYARVEPAHKLELVRALQDRGEVVAMTGDGVNDAPALRRADIGVALGQRGSDVAREAADMVVTDDDLATIVTATREGRGIYDNIRKVVDYLVAGNLSEIGVVVGALLLMPTLGVPLLPLQLLWINLLTDGLPALALGNDRHDRGLMPQPPRPRTAHLLDRHRLTHLTVRGTIMAAACLAAAAAASPYHPDPDHTRTVLLTTLVVTHLLYAFVARQPAAASLRDRLATTGWLGTPWLMAAVAGGLGLHLTIVLWPPAQTVFRTTTPTGRDWMVIGLGAVAALVATAVHRRIAGGSAGRARKADLPGPDRRQQ
jgi:P-type Ca2+ transporter type 2C